jgi:threonine synthase
MRQVQYYSTNRQVSNVDFLGALFQGQAPDKGLYMPSRIPVFGPGELEYLRCEAYPKTAAFVLTKYLGDVVLPERQENLCTDAYGFDVPLEPVADKLHVLRLDRGPTASFKDFAARMMARWMTALLQDRDKRLVVLVATSGDTGSAIAHAFHRVPGVSVVVLFPPAEVSDRQRRQMTTLGENISAVAVEGKFDDCQAMVKQAFADPELSSSVRLTSANSINIGRLLPQVVYYIYASLRLGPQSNVVFSIPSGNFGNAVGALLAKRMGAPIGSLVVSTNENNEVAEYLKTGIYRKIVPSRNCISNAMNVGHPSNLARIVDLYGGWMDENGTIRRKPDLDAMRKDLWAVSIDDGETRQTIRNAWAMYHLLLEPHGAVGWAGLTRFIEATGHGGPAVCVETAHPAKFPEDIVRLLKFSPDPPESLAGLEFRRETVDRLPAAYPAFRDYLVRRFAA